MRRSIFCAFSLAALLVLTASAPSRATGGEIGYIESFALAADRQAALEQLIPGTEDYYYYSCLHLQNTEQFDKVELLLGPWIKRYKYTSGVHEIRSRQALLTYGRAPQRSLDHIRSRLNLRFDHQREVVGQKPNLPRALDPQVISRETLRARAMRSHKNLDGFEDAALQWLTGERLNPARRRHLLSRLTRPDFANLARLVVADLSHTDSRGFGSLKIHHGLLLPQLDDALRGRPELLNQSAFVATYLHKLQPGADDDWRHDVQVQRGYLDRLWEFVSRLGPVHNSLKAHVLYHRLDFDRSHGVHDKERFMTYLRLPRNVPYINRDYMQVEANRRHAANLSQDYPTTLLRTVGNDEPLVRSYFLHFFVGEATYRPYQSYVDNDYLKHVLAETKVVNGLGESEQWYSLLPPAMYQALKDRVDLDFDPVNKRHFTGDEPVTLDVHVKNVETLIVKVFRINAANYYMQNLKEVNTDIELDGLHANRQTTMEYDDPPLRRIKRHFEFPELTRPGVYVVDFIGNGKSSRAVVRKGQLRHLVRTTGAGQAITVLDERDEIVKDARVWLSGREYQADAGGEITVPFSNRPGSQPFVIRRGEDAYLARFSHSAESYSLAAGMYVDRESLLSRAKAELIVRANLLLNGVPTALSVLEDVSLTIVSTDHDNVSSTQQIEDFQLLEDREASHEFQVPSRLARIQFTLQAYVKVLSQGGKRVPLTVSESYTLNDIDRTDKIDDLHLSWIDDAYWLDVLGLSGELLPDRAVHLELKHRDFKQTVHVNLQSDDRGRIELGELSDIQWLRAKSVTGQQRAWPLVVDRSVVPASIHGRAGEAVEVPFLGADEPRRDELSLIELRGGQFVADRFEHLKIEDSMIRLEELPPGDYDLLLKRDGHRVAVRISAGPEQAGYVLGRKRELELRYGSPVHISSVGRDGDSLVIQIRNPDSHARVHVLASRYVPAYSALGAMARVRDAEPYQVSVSRRESLYIEGREIGDEYRYIIERQYGAKFPGNMLGRPSLLLNPWSLRSTDAGRQDAEKGAKFAPSAQPPQSKSERAENGGGGAAQAGDFADLNYLTHGSVVISNIEPNEQGRIVIPLRDLGPCQHVRVVAVHPRGAVERSVSLQETPFESRDLRLAHGLDPQQHFTQQKQVSILAAGGQLRLQGVSSARYQAYDSLGRVYTLYSTLNDDPRLAEFRFILQWPDLDDEQKRKNYSKHACHELNFFLLHKDPQFFADVVEPYLASKRDKTLLDRWLVGADVSQYLGAWRHGQTNVVERILLGQRLEGESQRAARHVDELTQLLPPDASRLGFLFDTAIKGRALEVATLGDGLLTLDSVSSVEFNKRLAGQQGQDAGGARYGLAAKNGAVAGTAVGKSLEGLADMAQPEADFALKSRAGRKVEEELGRLSASANRRYSADEKKMADRYFAEGRKRGEVAQLYQMLDKTQEWAENNYYHRPIEEQNADLVKANAFWNDYAKHSPDEPFLSRHLADASSNFTEIMLALAVLDLPFEAARHESKFEGDTLTLTAGSPMIVFHEEIHDADLMADETPILVSQNFFRHGDRYRQVNNERLDKYVTDEFLVHTAYGCQIVITNPTSSPQKLDLLLQIPVGSLPVNNGQITRSVHIDLQPYNTQTVEYLFYFPLEGEYEHFPVHIAKNTDLLASAEPVLLRVVEKLSRVDRESWQYVSQNGTQDDVLKYLEKNNVQRTNLDKIAFRMGDSQFFGAVTGLLVSRHVYNHTLWSYSVKHNAPPRIREFLQHQDSFVKECGVYIDSPLLVIDPVIRKTYQHLDYRPLVNARAHQLGVRRQVLNDRMHSQYHRLLKVLSYRRDLNSDELMSVTYYLLLQDRVAEGLEFFARVNPQQLETKIQHDYFTAYVGFYTAEIQASRDIAERYADYPVDRWRSAFASVRSQLDELEGLAAKVVDDGNRDQQQAKLADNSPTFEFAVESKAVRVDYKNVKQIEVNYYLMDIELLFSRNPFVQQFSGQFSYIQPNLSQSMALPADKARFEFPLPAELHNQNVLVEISGGGDTKTQAYYSNSMALQLTEQYGQLRVTGEGDGEQAAKPLSKVYVKVYARMKNGEVKFYKDGYTDLRGRFDYSSLNTNELDFVQQFSLLILSDDDGAIVREAAPPKR